MSGICSQASSRSTSLIEMSKEGLRVVSELKDGQCKKRVL
jgi:hypothetical protein